MNQASQNNILIVNPDKFVRTFLVDALEHARFKIFNSVANSSGAVDGLKIGNIQAAILELDLGDSVDGYNLAHTLRTIEPNLGIIFLTDAQDSRFMVAAGSEKPTGSRYLVKKELENVSQLISVIGQTIYRPFYENVNLENKFSEFTDLQVEIWKEVAHGNSSGSIAKNHNISEKAVEGTLSRIYQHLGIHKSELTNVRIQLSEEFRKYQGKT